MLYFTRASYITNDYADAMHAWVINVHTMVPSGGRSAGLSRRMNTRVWECGVSTISFRPIVWAHEDKGSIFRLLILQYITEPVSLKYYGDQYSPFLSVKPFCMLFFIRVLVLLYCTNFCTHVILPFQKWYEPVMLLHFKTWLCRAYHKSDTLIPCLPAFNVLFNSVLSWLLYIIFIIYYVWYYIIFIDNIWYFSHALRPPDGPALCVTYRVWWYVRHIFEHRPVRRTVRRTVRLRRTVPSCEEYVKELVRIKNYSPCNVVSDQASRESVCTPIALGDATLPEGERATIVSCMSDVMTFLL